MLAVHLKDVSKRYGRRWALARLNLELEAGKSLLLTGHNGSGKTTLLRVIATATSPTAGELLVMGLHGRTDREEIRRQVALLSHASFLYEDLTAEQNLKVFARLISLPAHGVRPLLERVGLADRAEHPVRQFSAGMRKRLAIARLLIKQPKLALLDEPFGELDPGGIAEMEKIIRELKASGTALILATHLVEQGESLCDARLHLSQGRAA